MTHMPATPVTFDPPSGWKRVLTRCHECGSDEVSVRTHDSSCGSWEDDEFRCGRCGHSWWVDGIDS